MRNLALISSWDCFLPSSSITATTIDLDENVIYVASEIITLDGQVQVNVWKMDQSEGSKWVIVFIKKYFSCFHLKLLSLKVSSREDFLLSNGSFLRWAK